MTAQQVITLVDAIKPNAFGDGVKLDWINELDGRIQAEIWLFDDSEIVMPTASAELTAEAPYDGVYQMWLAYKIDFANGEYDKAANTKSAFDRAWTDYAAHVVENYDPIQAPYLPMYIGDIEHGEDEAKRIGYLRPGDLVMRAYCEIVEPFDGDAVSKTVILGTSSDDDAFIKSSTVDPTTAGRYVQRCRVKVPMNGIGVEAKQTCTGAEHGKAKFFLRVYRRRLQF